MAFPCSKTWINTNAKPCYHEKIVHHEFLDEGKTMAGLGSKHFFVPFPTTVFCLEGCSSFQVYLLLPCVCLINSPSQRQRGLEEKQRRLLHAYEALPGGLSTLSSLASYHAPSCGSYFCSLWGLFRKKRIGGTGLGLVSKGRMALARKVVSGRVDA